MKVEGSLLIACITKNVSVPLEAPDLDFFATPEKQMLGRLTQETKTIFISLMLTPIHTNKKGKGHPITCHDATEGQ
jgi:hypothetical protein